MVMRVKMDVGFKPRRASLVQIARAPEVNRTKHRGDNRVSYSFVGVLAGRRFETAGGIASHQSVDVMQRNHGLKTFLRKSYFPRCHGRLKWTSCKVHPSGYIPTSQRGQKREPRREEESSKVLLSVRHCTVCEVYPFQGSQESEREGKSRRALSSMLRQSHMRSLLGEKDVFCLLYVGSRADLERFSLLSAFTAKSDEAPGHHKLVLQSFILSPSPTLHVWMTFSVSHCDFRDNRSVVD
ncbi:uncharacterized protein BT62DRAFT_1013315 [Guyanagaster necrorhizus]|uniref:Uncharacterized protein n=1 Tax=Guyanagaster necrorhizus TaxID=856835 RepID=A0A9P7VFZ0_9AGAR|nr:uncharacterized protein BT62DRAFT_1013315 [Guyanagaster necrorhizus MCA 3950]KAG7439872.1 hypothetical protein BT62DRAFT_1013315 [Guyanagaster necrorhizus MCA 3950]